MNRLKVRLIPCRCQCWPSPRPRSNHHVTPWRGFASLPSSPSNADSAAPPPSTARAAPFYTLGLDINTQTIGYVLLSPSLHLLSSGLILPPTSLPPPTRLLHVRSQLLPLLSSLPPSSIVLPATESYLRSFATARFHLSSLFTLAEWNTLVCYALWEMTGTWPERIHPNAARAMWGLKKATGDGAERAKAIKEVAWEFVDRRVRREAEMGEGVGIDWTRKANGDLHPAQFDISDAFIIALTAATQRMQAASTHSLGQVGEEARKEKLGLPTVPTTRRVRRVSAKLPMEATALAEALTEAVALKRAVRKRSAKAEISEGGDGPS